MSQLTFYRGLSAVLLLLNLGILLWLFLHRPPHPPEGEHRPAPIERLGLDEAAIAVFEASLERHMQSMETLNQEKRNLLRQYFRPYTQGVAVDSSLRDEQLQRIGAIEGRRIVATETHFQDLRQVFLEGQTQDYQALIRDISRRILESPPKRPRRPKGF